ncbi:MAG: NAD(P)/FAD-dependent oxidoreductase [Spirochaetaceae bacterium]|nr:NAD(P)/FAD-dependent oxidoreductase [Spirochaetaceae bacterium]
MSEDTYDIIIIGSGLGGLAAAATLSKEGYSVLVLEQYHKLGGFGQSYKINDYIFDTAVHSVWFWEQIDELLKTEFGISLDVVPSRRNDRIIIGDTCEFMATSIPEMADQMKKIIPGESDNIQSYYDELIESQAGFVDWVNNPSDLAAKLRMLKYKDLWRKTLEEAVDSKVRDPLAKSLLYGYHDSYLYDYSWSYPAHHLYLTKYLYDGYQPVGGSQPLVDAFVYASEKYGAEFQTNSLVVKILTEGNEAKGVLLDDGRKIEAGTAVISNADGILTYEKLIGIEKLTSKMKNELKTWKRFAPSLSYYILNVGIDIDVEKVYGLKGDLTVYYPQNEVLKCLKTINAGVLGDDFWLWAVFPSVNDKTLAPPGHSVGVLSVLVPYDIENSSHASGAYNFDGLKAENTKGADYYKFKEVITKRILDRADEIFPGLSKHIVVKDLITPQTIEHTTLNHKGSTLEIDKLHLVGGWTEDGFSVPSVLTSGREVAFEISGKTGYRISADVNHRMERLRK